MKKLILLLAAITLTGVVAQAQGLRFNPEALKKKAATSDANLQNPKKNSKVNYWLDRGDTYYMLGAGMVENIYLGQHKNETFMLAGKPKEIGKATINGRNLETLKYPAFTAYLENDKIVLWTIDVVYDEKALDKSIEAYLKAASMEEKIIPKVREGLAKIGSFYLNEAQVIYLPQKRNKEAAISYGKSYDVFSLPVMGRIDTMSAYNAGYISIMEEDFENAAKYLGELEKVGYYKDGDVYYYLYYAYHSLGNEEKANEYMMKGSDKFPAHKELTNLRINLYIQSNRDINEIIAEIDEAIAKDPKNNAYYYYKAMMLEKNNDMEGALAMFKQVLEFTPNDFSANFNTGVLYSRQAEKLRQVLNEIPYKEQERYDKTLKEMESNYLESVKYYEKALEIQPANLDVLEVLKNIYFYFRDKQDGMMSKYETIKAKIDAMSADANMTQQRLQSM